MKRISTYGLLSHKRNLYTIPTLQGSGTIIDNGSEIKIRRSEKTRMKQYLWT